MFAFSVQVAALLPGWLIGMLGAALVGAVLLGAGAMLQKGVARRWVVLLAVLRMAAAGLFILALLQPVVSTTRTAQPVPELLVLVDVSQSMVQPSGTGQASRLEEARRSVLEGELARTLRSRFGLHWFRFDETATQVEESSLQALEPKGTTTRIGDSLIHALEQQRALGQAPSRVLLISDGNDHGTVDPAEAARRFGIAVDVLTPSSPPSLRNDKDSLDIADVQGARRVLLGSETHFRVTVARAALSAQDQPLVLELLEDGKKIKDWSLALKGGSAEQVFILAHRPPATGIRNYGFRIAGQETPPAKFTAQVVDSKFEILVLEDTWRWEYKFLHRLFEDDPSFRFTALLPRGGKSFVQFGSPDRRVNLVGMPQSRSDLEGFDLFFLGDVNSAKWAPGLANALAQLVIDGGKSLVLIAGPNLPQLAELPELHALLPVDLTRESGSPIGTPVPVQLRPDAASSPFFFQLRSGNELPLLDHVYPALRKRPGATVLLEAVKHRNAYGNLIVLAEHTVGRGRVLFVASDTLWKWQTLAPDNEGPTPYAIFWQQALRALAPARHGLGPVSLWLTPSRSRGTTGQPLSVQAEIHAERPLAQVKVQGTLAFPDGKRLPVAFGVDPVQPLRFRAEFVPPAPGVYAVSATVTAEGKAAAEASALVQVESARGEKDQGVDRVFLQRLAAATGGQMIDPGRPDTWPHPSETPLPPITQQRTIDVWNNFTLLFLLVALLGVDWFIRLLKGLV